MLFDANHRVLRPPDGPPGFPEENILIDKKSYGG
jgi:hypothetical protein